jgi:hypothetical protein
VRLNTDVAKVFVALSGLACLSLTMPPSAEAGGQWFLMSRHGGCADVGVLKRKVPDLGKIGDPDAFASFMRQKGYEVTSSPLSVPKGRAQKVSVPKKGLFLIFVTAELCRSAPRGRLSANDRWRT